MRRVDGRVGSDVLGVGPSLSGVEADESRRAMTRELDATKLGWSTSSRSATMGVGVGAVACVGREGTAGGVTVKAGSAMGGVIGVLSSSTTTATRADVFSRARYEELVATVLDSSASSLTIAATTTGEGEGEVGAACGESGTGLQGRDEVGETGSRWVTRRDSEARGCNGWSRGWRGSEGGRAGECVSGSGRRR